MFFHVLQVVIETGEADNVASLSFNSILLSMIKLHNTLHVPQTLIEVLSGDCFQRTQSGFSTTPRILIVVNILRPVSGSH